MSILTSLPAIIQKTKSVAQSGRAVMRSIGGSRAGKVGMAAAGAVGVSAAGSMIAGGVNRMMMDDGTEVRVRRRSRGISARELKTTQRTMKKIIKMYNKLPKRAAKGGKSCNCKGACKC